MKYFLLFLYFSVATCEDEYGFITKYIDMPLDHFSFRTNTTFKVRYLVNDSYYSDGNPIFIYTGNEGDISMFAQNTGFIFDLAPEFNALIVFAEHRYYGESLPFGNLSYTSPEYLGYLSVQQALADFVYLINDLQEQYAQKSSPLEKVPVITFGGSYGGMLSAWLKMKYPYSVVGAIASSSPIWQFKGLTSCGAFHKIVTDVVRSLGSEKCMNTINDSWSILRNETSNDQGKTDISSLFKLCDPLQTKDDIDVFLNWMEEIYENIVEVNYPYPASFLTPLPANPVHALCEKMDSIEIKSADDLLKAISTALEVYTNYTGETECNDILLRATPKLGETGWNFQACCDMIMPVCSTDEDMFENSAWNFTKYSDYCFEQYSVRPRNEEVPILEFGGKDLQTASNIIFSNGLRDPWSGGGVLTNISSTVLAFVMPDGAHHSDFRAANPLDTESVKNAREFHKKHIAGWLDTFYFQNLPKELYLIKKRKYSTYW